MIATALFYVAFPPAVLLIPEGNVFAAAVVMVLLGVNLGGASMLYRSMMADVVERDAQRSGESRGGLLYALMAMSRKMGGALAVGVVFWTLALIGFDSGGGGSEASIRYLGYIFVAVPMLGNLAIVAIMLRFRS